jgi:MoxR-like ATPase
LTASDVRSLSESLLEAVGRVIVGKREAVRLALVALFARGHLLIEDVPGTGKTTLARTLASALGSQFSRIQFTPDLLPADIVGVTIYNASDSSFTFRKGPVFAEVVLADEINRATPRTQSALLEAMQEGQVSVDGHSYALPDLFLVMATQNPVEMDGTFRLPEAQLDRFLLRLQIGYPSAEEEEAMLAQFEQWKHGVPDSLASSAVTERATVLAVQDVVRRTSVGENVRSYIRRIAQASRQHESVQLGVSPRGSLALQRAAQASASMDGRQYVLPDDVKALAPAVLGHRVVVETSAELRGLTGTGIIAALVKEVEVPIERQDAAADGCVPG